MRSCVLCTPYPFIIDHLLPIALSSGAEVLIFDEASQAVMQRFFPNVAFHRLPDIESSLPTLFSSYEVIFHSMLSWSSHAMALRSLFHQEKVRIVYVPHGNSDKRDVMQEDCLAHDGFLYYGQHMRDLLFEKSSQRKIELLFPMGNVRAAYFEENKPFLRAQFESLIGAKLDKRKKTFLYAPSWEEKDLVSSVDFLMQTLLPKYNLLIKLHPHFENNFPSEALALEAKLSLKGAHLISDFPLTYPLLDATDAFITDGRSSIGYDFLYFDRPLYFLGKSSSWLQECSAPFETLKEEISFEKNQKELSRKRRALYDYCFLQKKPFCPKSLFASFLSSKHHQDRTDHRTDDPCYK